MPDFMLLLHRPAEAPPTLSPEQIAAMIEDYSGWAGRLRAEGRIKAGEKLTQDAGRVMSAQRGRITGALPLPNAKASPQRHRTCVS